METYSLDWKPKTNMPHFDVGIAVTGIMTHVVKTQLPQYLQYFPFQGGYLFEYFFEEDLAFFQLINREIAGLGTPAIGKIKDFHLINKLKSIRQISKFPSFQDVYNIDNSLFSPELLTYVGTQQEMNFSWLHFEDYVVNYLNAFVLPDVLEKNKKRVYDVIPTPPRYDVQKILNNIYIIESKEMAMQGTCFYLTDVGFVTCQHSIFEDSVIFKANEINKRYPVHIRKQNPVIDLAIFDVEGIEVDKGLEIGNSDEVELNHQIAVAGFPNHKYGDTGIFSPGVVVGFRMVSSIRRILVNTPLIAGNSGGPVISNENKIIGVAVTGADRMENAHSTEEHGVVPISAIALL